MPRRGDIYIGAAGSETLLSPFGRKLAVSDKELSRKEQTASGRNIKEVVAVKKQIKLVYDTIDESALVQLLGYYALQTQLNFWDYTSEVPISSDPEVVIDPADYRNSYVVLMEPLDRERLLLGPNAQGLWSGVTAEFLEV